MGAARAAGGLIFTTCRASIPSRAYQEELREIHGQPKLAGLIRKVQEQEKEKLTLTAARHLELIRCSSRAGAGPAPVGSWQLPLLNESIASLDSRIRGIEAEVTELLEEYRYEVADLPQSPP